MHTPAPSDPTSDTTLPSDHGPELILIAAMDRQRGIGKGNALLWHLPQDLQHFKRTTLGCPVIMGRKTWDSIGRPLPGRRNIVITRNPAWAAAGAQPAASLEAALSLVGHEPKVFVIGGAQIYAQALPQAHTLVLTEVDTQCDADAFFPAWNAQEFKEVSRESHLGDQGWRFDFVTYRRRNAQ
jgi:dihydrofolate reductase